MCRKLFFFFLFNLYTEEGWDLLRVRMTGVWPSSGFVRDTNVSAKSMYGV